MGGPTLPRMRTMQEAVVTCSIYVEGSDLEAELDMAVTGGWGVLHGSTGDAGLCCHTEGAQLLLCCLQ